MTETTTGLQKMTRRALHRALLGVGALTGTGFKRGTHAAETGRSTMTGESIAATGVRRGYADGLHGQIHFRYAGDRNSGETPLMCLHASPLSGIVYDVWLAEMGKDRFVVAPDTPGYGGSDTPLEPPQIEDLADAMIAFMDSMGLERVDVMGYHTGSLTSVDLAMRYPDRIRKVVVISAPIFDDAIREQYQPMLTAPVPGFADALSSLADDIRKNPRGMFTDVPTDERYADISIERLRHYRTSNWGFRAAFAYDMTKTLPNVDQPLLILNPEDDLWELTRLAEPHIKNGRIHDLPGWTHGAMDSHTEDMATVVRAFLTE